MSNRSEVSGGEYTGVVFGRVLECGRHPNADKLSVCKVDAGTGEPLEYSVRCA